MIQIQASHEERLNLLAEVVSRGSRYRMLSKKHTKGYIVHDDVNVI